MITLYKRNNLDQVSWWSIAPVSATLDTATPTGYRTWWGNDHRTQSTDTENTQFTPESDKPTMSVEGQIETQVQEMIARKGYSRSIPKSAPEMPMLAQQWKDFYEKAQSLNSEVAHWPNFYWQPKLDGVRCIATPLDLYSRKNRKFTAVPHIELAMSSLVSDPKFGNIRLDGELYMHGADLQTIQSLVMPQAYNGHLFTNIEYRVFDVISDLPFKERYLLFNEAIAMIQEEWKQLEPSIFKKGACPVVAVPTNYVDCPTHSPEIPRHLQDLHNNVVAGGYEGLILRNPEAPYQCNYRTFDLLKYKSFCDAEFLIIDVLPAKDDMGVFLCQTAKGNKFKVTPSWTHSRKRQMLRYKDNYVGRWLTVHYERLSKDGMPLKPIGKTIRND